MFEQVRGNKRNSILLMLFFVFLVVSLGVVLGYVWGDVYVGFFAAAFISIPYTAFSYFSGDKLIHAMTGARPVTKEEQPYLYHTVEGLALAAGVPTPKAYVIEDSALNAFATGRDPEHSSITVTSGLLKVMNRQELEGVLAHEMSHIKNYDIRMMMLATVLIGLTTLLSDFILRSMWYGRGGRRRSREGGGSAQLILLLVGILFALMAPFIGRLISLAVSRQREYLADANAAVLTRYPPGLASALKKIKNDPDPLVDNANKATAHLFISTPFRDKKGFVVNLFSTHPEIDDRIKRLEAL